MSTYEGDCAGGTYGGSEGNNVIDVDYGRFADAEEVCGQEGFEDVETVFDAVDVAVGMGIGGVVVGFIE